MNRDIKLENTLLDGSKRPLLKICDFGYSKNDKDSVPKSKVGTPGYTGVRPICPMPELRPAETTLWQMCSQLLLFALAVLHATMPAAARRICQCFDRKRLRGMFVLGMRSAGGNI